MTGSWKTMHRFRKSSFEQTIHPAYTQIVRALQRDGWIVVRRRGSHIRLRKHSGDEILKLTIPAHRPVKGSTLAHILKRAKIDQSRFLELL
jgi:predicted RNA binding protein YcfA (HicA-like mRNA interferase family)